MTYTIQLRRDNAADWTSVNPILHDGEFGWERDTGKFKMGDGATVWNSLPYTSAVPDDLVEALDDLSDVDLTGAAAGKILGTEDGTTWGPVDPPAAGDPNAMHSAPAALLYSYDNVEPTSPQDGDLWTNPDEDPLPAGVNDDDVRAITTAQLVEGAGIDISAVGDTLVLSTVVRDRRWFAKSTARISKDFRDPADLTGAIRVDNSVSNAAAQLRMLVSQEADSLSIMLDGATTADAAGEMHGYVWPGVIAVGESLETHTIEGGPSYNYSWCGPVIADGVTYGAGNQVFFPWWSGGSAPNPQDGLWTNWNNRAAFTDRNDGGYLSTRYSRIRRATTNTWAYELSTDGIRWLTIATRTLTMTPSHFGYAGGQWGGTGKRIFSFDNLRVGTP